MVTVVVYWTGTAMLAAAVVAIHGIPPLHYSRRAWLAVVGRLAIAGGVLILGGAVYFSVA